MTPTQLKRWRRFSLGLARSGYPTLTRARRRKLYAAITNCIDCIVCDYDIADIRDWDGNKGSAYVCDELTDYLWDHRYERDGRDESVRGRFGTMLSACVRAGFDVAIKPSGGVVGFTVGDVRGAFAGRLPKWVSTWFDPPLTLATPDDEDVWL